MVLHTPHSEDNGDTTGGSPRSVELHRIIATERRLLDPICTITEFENYSVYRSDRFPRYYGGNGIDIPHPRERGLAEWEEIFREHFPAGEFVHTTFTFPHRPEFEAMMDAARESGYHVEVSCYLLAQDTGHAHAPAPGLVVRTVATEEDWERLGTFYLKESEDYDWHNPAVTSVEEDTLFAKTRHTSEVVGIEWYTLTPENSTEILCALGMFKHDGICRLQDVWTSKEHRRRGFAGMLVSDALRRALGPQQAEGLAVCADKDYYALDLYRKLGFTQRGESVTLMRYPVTNPDYHQ